MRKVSTGAKRVAAMLVLLTLISGNALAAFQPPAKSHRSLIKRLILWILDDPLDVPKP